MSKGKEKPNLWNNFLSSWITEHVNYFQRNKLHNSKNAILSVIVHITCICSVKGIWICSIPVLVQWSLCTPALTEPGQVSHVLGVGSFLSPPELWVKRTVCCQNFQHNSGAGTDCYWGFHNPAGHQGTLAVDSHLSALFLTSFCF